MVSWSGRGVARSVGAGAQRPCMLTGAPLISTAMVPSHARRRRPVGRVSTWTTVSVPPTQPAEEVRQLVGRHQRLVVMVTPPSSSGSTSTRCVQRAVARHLLSRSPGPDSMAKTVSGSAA